MFISMRAHRKWKQVDTMLKQIGDLETLHKKSQAQATEQELGVLREKLNLLLIDKAKTK